MSNNTRVSIPIEQYRSDPSTPTWDLPEWGHPLSQGVLPLFFGVRGQLIPIGSAFTVGDGVAFLVSAAHNVLEVFNHELRLQHLVSAPTLPKAIAVKEVAIYVLYHRSADDEPTRIEFTLWPVESFTGAPPSDVVLGFPQFTDTFPTLVMPLSFDVPAPGTRVWSVGYTDFTVPKGGIDLERVTNGTFDWLTEYSHRFVVVEGLVEHIFVRRFASSFLNGPCFTFGADVPHGLSGGPVFDTSGLVRGVTSAGAAHYFNRPATIASFLQPLLFKKVRAGIRLGPMRVEGIQQIIDWIIRGVIKTDGSETRIPISEIEGEYSAGLSVPKSFAGSVHADLRGLLDGIVPEPDPSDEALPSARVALPEMKRAMCRIGCRLMNLHCAVA